MSDSHSEPLPKATIWSLKLLCMDNLLLCRRKKAAKHKKIFFHGIVSVSLPWLKIMRLAETFTKYRAKK